MQNILGIGPSGIGIIVAVYMAITLVLDVPAGVLADRWGRKRTLLLALLCFILADVVLGLSTNFGMYIFGTVFWGLFTVLYYGTYEALLFDTSKQLGKSAVYEKLNATQQAWFMLGIGISSIAAGAFVYVLDFRSIFLISIIPLVLAGAAALRLTEPPMQADDEPVEEEIVSHWQHLKEAFREILHSDRLKLIALGMVIVLVVTTPVYELGQYIYMAVFNNNEAAVAVSNGVAGLILVAGFLIATRLRSSIVYLLSLCVAVFVITAWLRNMTSLAAFMLIFLIMPVVENRIQVAVQHTVSARKRSTMTSAINFMGNVVVVPGATYFEYSCARAVDMDGLRSAGCVSYCIRCNFILYRRYTGGIVDI